jgi:hypothetical protein
MVTNYLVIFKSAMARLVMLFIINDLTALVHHLPGGPSFSALFAERWDLRTRRDLRIKNTWGFENRTRWVTHPLQPGFPLSAPSF